MAHEYQGERKAGAIVEWANTEVPNRVDTVGSASDIQRWVKKVRATLHSQSYNLKLTVMPHRAEGYRPSRCLAQLARQITSPLANPQ